MMTDATYIRGDESSSSTSASSAGVRRWIALESTIGPTTAAYISSVMTGETAAYHSRILRLQSYLNKCIRNGFLTQKSSVLAWNVWAALNRQFSGCLTVPNAQPTDDGTMVYVWENKEGYAEIEIFADGRIELYAHDIEFSSVSDLEFNYNDFADGSINPVLVELVGWLGPFAEVNA